MKKSSRSTKKPQPNPPLPHEDLNVQRTILCLHACVLETISERISDAINRMPPELHADVCALLDGAEAEMTKAAQVLRQKAEAAK